MSPVAGRPCLEGVLQEGLHAPIQPVVALVLVGTLDVCDDVAEDHHPQLLVRALEQAEE